MQAALKEVFGPMFEAMLNGEMENYLGYEPNSREEKEPTNRRNFDKTISMLAACRKSASALMDDCVINFV